MHGLNQVALLEHAEAISVVAEPQSQAVQNPVLEHTLVLGIPFELAAHPIQPPVEVHSEAAQLLPTPAHTQPQAHHTALLVVLEQHFAVGVGFQLKISMLFNELPLQEVENGGGRQALHSQLPLCQIHLVVVLNGKTLQVVVPSI